MAGIYIHIPFCKQACSYCNFHFSTSLAKKDAMVKAIKRELAMRQNIMTLDTADSIYFGGGTPSLLSINELEDIIETIRQHVRIRGDAEITVECNPDDIDAEWTRHIRDTGVNRISLGVQSFHDRDLSMMRRVHDASRAMHTLELLMGLDDMNVSIDLIYGIPGMKDEEWLDNLARAKDFGVPHLSCYALTIEPRTQLAVLIKRGKFTPPSEDMQSGHFDILMDWAEESEYMHYEISNFCKPGFRAKHNSSYWSQEPYLGLGPSAHSFDGRRRWWNIANNTLYLKAIGENRLPSEEEVLTETDKYNEYIMTGLRTSRGVQREIIAGFGGSFLAQFEDQVNHQLDLKTIESKEEGRFVLTRKGKHLADRVASGFFIV